MKKLVLLFILFIIHIEHKAQEIKILFGGDVTFGDTYQSVANIKNNYGYSFENIMPIIDSCDYFVINLETAITESNQKIQKQFNFKAHKEDLLILKAGKVNAVTLGNNHSYDYGKKGLFDTFDALDEYDIPYFGAGRNYNDARKAHRTIIKGLKFSFLGFGNTELEESFVYLPNRNHEDIAGLIKREKEISDIVVVFFHFGKEMETKANNNQIFLAHLCIDSGADIVVDGHPHVTQPVEIYKNKPIAYSLGNFIFGGNRKGPKYGMLFQVTICNKNISYKTIPIIVDATLTNYRPEISQSNLN